MNFGRRTPSSGKNFDTDDEADFQEARAARPSEYSRADQTPLGALREHKWDLTGIKSWYLRDQIYYNYEPNLI